MRGKTGWPDERTRARMENGNNKGELKEREVFSEGQKNEEEGHSWETGIGNPGLHMHWYPYVAWGIYCTNKQRGHEGRKEFFLLYAQAKYDLKGSVVLSSNPGIPRNFQGTLKNWLVLVASSFLFCSPTIPWYLCSHLASQKTSPRFGKWPKFT